MCITESLCCTIGINNIVNELSVQFSCSVMSSSFQPHGLQHSRPPCPSPGPGAYSNSCPSNRWCHPTISSSVVPFSSCLPSFPASGSFQMSHFWHQVATHSSVLAWRIPGTGEPGGLSFLSLECTLAGWWQTVLRQYL